jgi:FAD:protein FMN transferase
MDNRKKNLLYSIILLAAIFVVYKCRSSQESSAEALRVEGRTMGTTYHVTYFDKEGRNFGAAIDSLLLVVNKSINTYDPSSEVSQFNRNPRGVKIQLPYLLPPLEVAKEIHSASSGAFDLTVMPLVDAWGFGPGKRIKTDSTTVDSILTFVGFEKIKLMKDSITKSDPRTQLDFGGIGQGYGADVIAYFLRSKGISNMLVELGGEGMAIGRNIKTGRPWEIGILDPGSTVDHQFFKAYVSLSDRSFTTSGNYFNFHEVNGVKYSHTIDPETGFPARKAILSASVFAENCTIADAWGTAFMVMGHEKAMQVVRQHPEIDVLLFYSDPSGEVKSFVTDGIRASIKFEEEK